MTQTDVPARPAEGIDRELAGTQVRFLAARGLWWPAEQTLFVADVHLGKAESFRALGVPVPAGATLATLDRLAAIVEACDARRLVILGDLLHARAAQSDAVIGPLAAWMRLRPRLRLSLVRGNHDERAGDPPAALGIDLMDAPHRLGPFCLCHEPADAQAGLPQAAADAALPHPQGYRLAGHQHPAVRLSGRASRPIRLPCFRVGQAQTVLPAFGEFTGSATVTPQAGETLLAIATDRIFALPPVAARR